MLPRVLIVVAVVTALKLGVRYGLVATVSDSLLLLFRAMDAAVVTVATAWAAMGPPLPRRSAAPIRALLSGLLLTLGLAIVNVALQMPDQIARSMDTLEIVARVIFTVVPNAVLLGPIGGFVFWILGSLLATAWMFVKLPRATNEAREASTGRADRTSTGRATANRRRPTSSRSGR